MVAGVARGGSSVIAAALADYAESKLALATFPTVVLSSPLSVIRSLRMVGIVQSLHQHRPDSDAWE